MYCMYDVRHDMQVPCTRYLAINRLYLYTERVSERTLNVNQILTLIPQRNDFCYDSRKKLTSN